MAKRNGVLFVPPPTPTAPRSLRSSPQINTLAILASLGNYANAAAKERVLTLTPTPTQAKTVRDISEFAETPLSSTGTA